MTNTDHAAEIIERATRGAHTTDGHLMKMCDHTAQIIAEALADEGLITPGPQIIRTREELRELDPDTLLESNSAYNRAFEAKHPQWIAAQGRRVGRGWLPAVVIATGEQVRAARQALEEATE